MCSSSKTPKYFTTKWIGVIFFAIYLKFKARGLISPYRCGTTSFSQLNQMSQSGQDTFFYFMFSLTCKVLVMFVAFLLFYSI